jgi:hypothetical protein
MDAESELLAEMKREYLKLDERLEQALRHVEELEGENNLLKRNLAIATQTLAAIRWNLDMGEKIVKAQKEGRLSP